MNVSESVPLINTFTAAWNAMDPQAVLVHFTDDAVLALDPPPPGSPGEYRGKEQILGFLQYLAPGFHTFDTSNHVAEGGTLSWDGALASDRLRERGLERAPFHAQASLDRGKFSTLSVTFDQSAREKLQKA